MPRKLNTLLAAGSLVALLHPALGGAQPTPAPGPNRATAHDASTAAAQGSNSAEPPFRVAGIVVGPHAKRVQLIVQEASGRGGRAVTLKEGASLEGFVIREIEQRQIRVEKDGREYRLGLSNPHPLQEPPPLPSPAQAAKAPKPATSAPPGTASEAPKGAPQVSGEAGERHDAAPDARQGEDEAPDQEPPQDGGG
jgi:type II secretory pathway component PulC